MIDKNKNIKKVIILILSLLILISLYFVVKNVYALFQSDANSITKIDTANWKVILNNEDISSGTTKSFTIDSVNIEGSQYVKSGKFAPGMKGYFNIEIEAQAQVAIRYDITFDTTKIDEENINITSIKAISNAEELVRTGKNTYTKVISLGEAQTGISNTIQVLIDWQNDENYNERDTKIGITKDYAIQIPINVEVTQYLGEEIVQYVE